MRHTQQIPLFVYLIFIPMMVFVISWFYFMLVKPEQWLEWFVNKPYRQWGLQVSIVDKERFRKTTRLYAMLPLLGAFLGLAAALIVWLKTGTH